MVTTRRSQAPLHHTHAPPSLSPTALAINWAQLLLAPLPAYLLARAPPPALASLRPFPAANALLGGSLFLGWLASLVQGSGWLIDPYWVFIVWPCLDRWYASACPSPSPRGTLISALTALWALRLQHSYLRRERWMVGAREDWRYADMRGRVGPVAWAVGSLAAVYALQQGLLVGLALPHYASRCVAGVAGAPLRPWPDAVSVGVALAGLALAKAADDQLFAYGARTKKPIILDTGVWGWSRHPNYLGETLFWWGLASLGVAAGGGRRPQWWVLAGAAANTACLAGVTVMTEARTAGRPGRGRAWGEYCRRVPCWFGVRGGGVRVPLTVGGR